MWMSLEVDISKAFEWDQPWQTLDWWLVGDCEVECPLSHSHIPSTHRLCDTGIPSAWNAGSSWPPYTKDMLQPAHTSSWEPIELSPKTMFIEFTLVVSNWDVWVFTPWKLANTRNQYFSLFLNSGEPAYLRTRDLTWSCPSLSQS